MNDEWESIGTVCVDSGQIQIADPCYSEDKRNDLGVVLSPGFGDGTYEVKVRRYTGEGCRVGLPERHPGRIAEVRIICIDDEAP